MPDKTLVPKELSWLSFNERVLQEAADESNPIVERLRFLGIFSNNQDEFFEVRVADLRRKLVLEEQTGSGKGTRKLLKHVHNKLSELSEAFDATFEACIAELKRRHVYFVNEQELSTKQSNWLKRYFADHVLRHLVPIFVTDSIDLTKTLQSGVSYLVVELKRKHEVQYAILDIPESVNRILQLPNEGNNIRKYFMILDDAIRHCLNQVFVDYVSYKEANAWSMKLSRDAEYTLEDDIEMSLIEKMEAGVKQRISTPAVRVTFDRDTPDAVKELFLEKLNFDNDDETVTLGGKYRNFKDFIGFPNPGKKYLENKPLPALNCKAFDKAPNVFSAIEQQDILLYYPYQKFSYFTEVLRQAAFDPAVTAIKLNIYRAAKNSRVVESLLDARRNGKRVTVNVELRARFDEEHNLKLSETLADAGVKVLFGINGLKVHSKLLLITRLIDGEERSYAHLGTGNFNEKTARIYTDFSLFTAHSEICNEVDNVFNFIEQSYRRFPFNHLLVSPINAREQLSSMIRAEIKAAKNKKPSGITLKVNNLVDKQITNLLYDANRAGVKVRIIVRGMCDLIPGVEGMSENIHVISIVDRFLEHPRCFIFHNGGKKRVFIGSADLMGRNLDNRVEVICPVYDEVAQKRVIDVIELQFKDRAKARQIDAEQSNTYVKRGNRKKIRSQIATYEYIKDEEKLN